MARGQHSGGGSVPLDQLRSPFGFVPITPKVYFPKWDKHVSMDYPLAEGISGTLEYEVLAKSPLFVRGRKGEFARLPDGTCAIPGTTVRGVVRSVLEIASFGKMNPELVNDRRYGVRDLHNRDLYGSHMAEIRNETPTPLVTAGWLRRRSDDTENPAEIRPCHFAKVDYGMIEQHARATGRHTYDPGRKARSAPKKYQDWCSHRPEDAAFFDDLRVRCEVHVHRSASLGSSWLADFGEVESLGGLGASTGGLLGGGGLRGGGEGLRGGLTSGGGQPVDATFVFTGQPQSWNPAGVSKRRGAGNPKHHDFVFWDAPAAPLLLVNKRALRDFEFIHSDTGQQHRATSQANEEWGFWQQRFRKGSQVPVFFILEKGRGDRVLRSFGLAMMFRLAYRLSIHDALQKSQPECVSPNPDLVELLFGRTRDDENERQPGYKGRVSFGVARLQGKERRLKPIRCVLGAPKASYYPAYISQGRTTADGSHVVGEYTTFMDKDAKLAGWKRYRPQDTQLRPPLPAKENERVQTTFRPLEQRSRFRGRMRLHNVLPVELGALLWALELGGVSGVYHGLGLAKPYGFGRVQIEVVGDAEESLARNDGDSVDLSFCRNAFVEAMDQFCDRGPGGFLQTREIQSLLALARPLPSKSEDGRYMRLDHPAFRNEFTAAKQARLVLSPAVDPQTVPAPLAATVPQRDLTGPLTHEAFLKEVDDLRSSVGGSPSALFQQKTREVLGLIDRATDRASAIARVQKLLKKKHWAKLKDKSEELAKLYGILFEE